MTTIESLRGHARWGLALLAGLTALVFSGAPAQAQEVCADIEGIAGEVLDLYLDELDDEWGVDLNDSDLCTTLTKNFIKACQNAVKNSVKCIDKQLGTLSKQNQTVCKTVYAGNDASACANSYKEDAKDDSDEVGSIGDSESEICETFAAADFFDVCVSGF
jgi:hypothetical protein